MAALCPKAEKIIRDNNIKLRPENRQKLATYDPDTQVRWLVNPKVEFMIQKWTNDVLAQLRERRVQAGSQSKPGTQNNSGKPTNKSPSPPQTPPQSDPDDEPIMGLFGDDDDF
jgi:hypothetical protein